MLAIQAAILGLVQGLAEFIPISSSAHLVIVPWLFGWTDPILRGLTFDVALHIGTLIALLVYFAADWGKLIVAFFKSIAERKIGDDPDRRMVWLLIVACIPGGIAGVLFESKISELFHPGGSISGAAMLWMAAIIALLGAILLLAEKFGTRSVGFGKIGWKEAITIGLAQALAIFPGVSRSGSTITAGLAIGLERPAAARFSFLLSAPIIAGAGAKSLIELVKGAKSGAIPHSELLLFPIGLVVAAVSGYICIKFLLAYLQKHSTKVFVWYRWALAVFVAIVALSRGIS
ncbi:MAG TPA: undecaprenyl-diphosphatase UppP [Rectinemataceae bacterium]|nr:undecaprenyl-diphosphatase UppP [Rectinemataceae bacterium]